MDFVELGGSCVVGGLNLMLEAAFGEPHGYTDTRLADVPTALYIIEIAKMSEDRDEWFPCGKWATIQAIQERCERQLRTLFVNTQ
ncbi:MAG: hypothetical protein Q8P56_01510 [Candidatus Uhrbacteria bacterium]|nr:hypothetical protein [Candidatus Uhrbacteria bacterium]